MPPENTVLNGAIFMQNGEKLCEIVDIPEFIDTELPEADPDDFIISAHWPECMMFDISMTKQQTKRILKFFEKETKRIDRAVRRDKRFKEKMRRKAQKDGMR